MSGIKLKAYKEVHGDDDLLLGVVRLITEATQRGDKILFIEQPREMQNDRDRFMQKISMQITDYFGTLNSLMTSYIMAPRESEIRIRIREQFLATMCSYAKIRIVCADITNRDPMLDITTKYLDLTCDAPEAFCAMTSVEKASALGCSIDSVGEIVAGLDASVANGTFMENVRKQKSGRLSADRGVAKFMLSQMAGASAIAIYGAEHLYFDRSDSLASILHEEMGEGFEVYDISTQGALVKVQAPTRGHRAAATGEEHLRKA